ncbi:solute carrier family 10 (sodium/bile acid cotransporter), member 7 [Sphingomonas palmae]|uniref:Solute carrier family 10 (Sodium/bile acid cotransporter), member 7 n=1 Tax=Sphingomonas palmae TaxID=1855283 RepID=A0A1H7J974_9SPHN|nr:bile acid:sodium symporter family protein [Sphingomonas palmae]SEK70417.1 solute carrier family 10 (sodium/bile acid cotransporter), member 7 [Sphingomonas palmae]
MSFIRRFIDPYLLLLLATVALAAVLPARGEGARVAEVAVTVAVALLFFLYGARLAPAAIWAGLTHWRLQGLVFLSTFALFPLLGLAVSGVARAWVPGEIAAGLLFLTLLPSTVQSSIAFTGIAGGNVPAALCSASVSNLVGTVLTPLIVAVVFPLTGLLPAAAGGGVSLHAIEGIAAQILLPFVAGQVARPLIGEWIARHKGPTSLVDRGSILLVVYAAFSEGMVSGVWQAVSAGDLALVLLCDGLLLAAVIAGTTWMSRALGFSKPDEIAIVFCGSKKSMASGIPMATILFAGSSVSLIVLPLMIFHQVQLFVCAVLARRYAARGAGGVDPARADERVVEAAVDSR